MSTMFWLSRNRSVPQNKTRTADGLSDPLPPSTPKKKCTYHQPFLLLPVLLNFAPPPLTPFLTPVYQFHPEYQ